ncbi:hypothetical protein E1287_35495 [Actinomadura sp. KC06]|uniref:arsenate-mycothiol transferase ArsC n=1 Tax=Actinomadura sp. KC06 TaxID=2530369 RepID=UPI0010505020|nr:hypothetical protein [Actinomadura sp. KC06]TDD27025.1 hypothetical protein E1287_35495 [Actinomadura sp. KC06]
MSLLERAAQHAFEFYGEAIPLAECQAVTTESYDLLARTAKIKHHLVPLAERWSIDRLRRLGILANRLSHAALEVLFVDRHDTATAPMAAALLTGYARGRVHAGSAGRAPGDAVHPAAVQAMSDTGVDLGQAFPKPLTDDALQAADVIVLLGDVPNPPTSPNPPPRAVRWRDARCDAGRSTTWQPAGRSPPRRSRRPATTSIAASCCCSPIYCRHPSGANELGTKLASFPSSLRIRPLNRTIPGCPNGLECRKG